MEQLKYGLQHFGIEHTTIQFECCSCAGGLAACCPSVD
jgi:hypothetical protein